MRYLIAVAALCLAGSAMAETWTVDDDGPADFDNIQAAVDAASDGDEILVEAGTYTGTGDQVIDMLGKSITLKSTSGPDTTVIDGQSIRRGIICQSGETTLTVIQGFSVRACHASWYDWNGNGNADYWEYFGGGIWNRGGSGPTVIACRFVANIAEYGGAVCNFDEFSLANEPALIQCTFEGNSAGQGVGGAVYSYASSPLMQSCDFIGNSAYWGGGVLNTAGSHAVLAACTFTNNNATSDGGAIYNDGSSASCTDCSFTNNAAHEGGAVFNADPSSSSNSPLFIGCNFDSNSAIDEGGGMHNFSVSPQIDSCTFTNNAASSGGGILSWNASVPVISNTSLCGNAPTNITGPWSDQGGNELSETCGDCPDMTGDGLVGTDEILGILSSWGTDDPIADVDGSGIVDTNDILLVLSAWGPCP